MIWKGRLPENWPKGYSLHVQNLTDGPGYVAMAHYYEDGMRFAALVSQAYGASEQEAWDRGVAQVMGANYSVL